MSTLAMNENLEIQPVEIDLLQQIVSKLPTVGTIKIINKNYAYVDIHDDFIYP